MGHSAIEWLVAMSPLTKDAPSVSCILQGNHEGQKLCFESIDSFVCIRALLDFSV